MSAQKKDVSGFKRIYDANKELVFKTAMRYSDNRYHIAQEITQDVFLKLYSCFDTYEDEYLPAWLVTVTRNIALNYKQKAMRELPDEDIELTMDLTVMEEGTEDIIFDRMYEEERINLSHSILDELYKVNERWYEAMTMTYCMKMKQKDVAEKLGISIEVLNSVLYRARKWIRNNHKPEE